MTQEEEMWLRELAAEQCVIPQVTARLGPMSLWSKDGLEAEIRRAVEAEREACAKIAEKQRYAMFISLTSHPAQNGTAVGIANAIRARGEA
jgi:hypothetical protein